jgi:Uma2 family endonuclease
MAAELLFEGGNMPESLLDEEIILDAESAGLFMSPEEFDNIEQYDENFRYELINGVVVVSPIPLFEETDPNDLLGHFLKNYQRNHPQGKVLDATMPQQYVRTSTGRRIADRLLWIGLGRYPDRRNDVAKIAVEFVSGSKRDRQRDYVDKQSEYMEVGIQEYWIIDRFKRQMTVFLNEPSGIREQVISEKETHESPLLPGFQLPVGEILAEADKAAKAN